MNIWPGVPRRGQTLQEALDGGWSTFDRVGESARQIGTAFEIGNASDARGVLFDRALFDQLSFME